MAWVYILLCSDDSYYVGSTVDLQARLGQHQAGEGAAYTRHRLPVELLWAADFSSIRDAFAYEKQVQGWSRKKREALMEGRFDLLPRLASRNWSARHPVSAVQTVRTAEARPSQVPQPPASEDDPWAPPDAP